MRIFLANPALAVSILAALAIGGCDNATMANDASVSDTGAGDGAVPGDTGTLDSGLDGSAHDHDAARHDDAPHHGDTSLTDSPAADTHPPSDASHHADAGGGMASTDCAMAPEIHPGEWARNIPFRRDGGSSACGGMNAHYVSVDIGPATAAVISINTRGFTASLGVKSTCSGSCQSTFAPPAGVLSAEFLVSFTGERFIAIGSMGTAAEGASFDIRVTPIRSSTNGTCAAATALTDRTSIVLENLQVANAGTCGDATDAVFYSATIPAGQRLTAAVIPSGAAVTNLVVDVQSGCSSSSCIAEIDDSVLGEQIVQDNTTGSTPLNVIIGVRPSLPGGFAPAPFSIGASISAPAYTVTEAASAACEDISSGRAVPVRGDGDDEVSDLRHFGFDFPFYGHNYDHYVVDSNGRIVLVAGHDLEPTTEWINTPMPDPALRFATVAPFWDDLAHSTASGATPEVRTGALSDGRYVVQWTDFGIASRPNARLSFQVIFSPSGNLEFRYCRLDASSTEPANRQTGSSATIGIQSDQGDAHVIGYSLAGIAEVGRSYLFAPVVD